MFFFVCLLYNIMFSMLVIAINMNQLAGIFYLFVFLREEKRDTERETKSEENIHVNYSMND